MQTNLVILDKVRFAHADRFIFENISFSIEKSKITAIMGPSGSGKTTLLRLIGGLLTPNAGDIYVDNQLVHKLSRKDLHKLRRKIGLLFQNGALFTHMSVFENVAFPLREHTTLNEQQLHELVLLKLAAVGLNDAQHMMPAELSGGMARRVALARAIALDPLLMMYDEPFTGQDPISMGILVRLIKQLNQALQTTTIIVSHDVAETCAIADYIYLLGDNKIIAYGTPENLLNSTLPEVHKFMHADHGDIM